jgi:hypothetical protein
MSGAIPALPQYAFMAWCSVTAQGQLYLYRPLLKFLGPVDLDIKLIIYTYSELPP